jgi:hypothetical protein
MNKNECGSEALRIVSLVVFTATCLPSLGTSWLLCFWGPRDLCPSLLRPARGISVRYSKPVVCFLLFALVPSVAVCD